MKKWLSNIGLMLTSTLVMLLICEAFVRFGFPQQLAPVKFKFDKEIGLMHVPNTKGKEYYPGVYKFSFTNGANGFRNSHKGVVPDFVKKRVMLVGDSFTYGKGVNDEETFAYRLQDAVIKDSIQIINAGVEGRGTDHALRSYQYYKDAYQPNTVVYFAHYNDLADNIRQEYFNIVNDTTLVPKTFEAYTGGYKEKLQKSKTYNWLISNSHFFALAKTVLVKKLMPSQIVKYDKNLDMEEAKRLTCIFIDQFKKEVEADGRKFVAYYIPSREDLDARFGGVISEQESFFENYFTEKNITFHNLSEEFNGVDAAEIKKRYYLLEGHWNPYGHQLAAEKLKTDANGLY